MLSDDPIQVPSSIPFEFELVAAPADLAQLVNTYFVITTQKDRIAEILPAYSAQLMIYAKGDGTLKPEDGPVYYSDTITFTAPLLNAVPCTINGPALILGASLTPLGWYCLAGLPADEINNRTVPASLIISPAERKNLENLAHAVGNGTAARETVFAAIGDALRARSDTLDPEHVRFVSTVIDWLSGSLNPTLDSLYDRVSVSRRTAQRLCRRYFGVSPSRLIKRFRAIRAAMLLTNPQLPETMRNEIISAYFDQAHLIRDIRRYTGRTPGTLRDDSFVQDTFDPGAHGTPAQILR